MNVPPARLVVALVAALLATGCATSATGSPSPSASNAAPSATASPATGLGSIVIVGRIVTMDQPPIAEALFIEDGTLVAVGTRDEVLARADDHVPVIDIGENVAYPGFIDAHAHWIGDRGYYDIETPAEAMDAAISRGWTSISEQWVNPERLEELTTLAADDALPLRVDAYLALNCDREFLGDWYTSREPGPVDDHLRVEGLKIHLDDGSGHAINWDPEELTGTIGRADEAGRQVSVHSMSSAAQELVLDAFEAAIGTTGPQSAPSPHRACRPGDRRGAGPHGRVGPPHRDPPRWRT
jgi:predicted amidohydrolase YtcJ